MATPIRGAIVADSAIIVLYKESMVVRFSDGVTSNNMLNKNKTVPVMETPMMMLNNTNRYKDELITYKKGVMLMPNVAMTIERVYPYLSANLPHKLAVKIDERPEAIEIAASHISLAFNVFMV